MATPNASSQPSADAPTDGGQRTVVCVDGLCCESEAALIHKRLGRMDGVADLQVDVVGRRVVVTHDASRVSPQDLAADLDHAGLDAYLPDESGGSGHAHTGSAVPIRLLAAAVLLVISLAAYWWPPLRWAALGAIAVGIGPILRVAWSAARDRVLDMNVLMTLAVVGAVLIGEWVEGATVVVLFALSTYLEQRSLDRARAAVAAVASLVPDTAVLADGGREVPADSVQVGTAIAVRPGSRVPLDGVVANGSSAVDESMLTGESVPVTRGVGDFVSAGTVNGSGYLEVRTTATLGGSAVARLARLVDESQQLRAPSERSVDRFAKVYTPLVVAAAAAIAVVPVLMGAAWSDSVYRALVVLVVACPCALVISTPVTVVSGIARAARDGVLIKGGLHLEMLGRLQALALDKTGTLTEGRFRVVDCVPVAALSSGQLDGDRREAAYGPSRDAGTDDAIDSHHLLGAVESQSNHPIAEALAAHASSSDSHPHTATGFEIVEGEGVAALVGQRTVHVGNVQMADRLGWHGAHEQALHDQWAAEGKTVVFHGVDGELSGLHALADVPRDDAADAVASLRGMGLRVVMLTGDRPEVADTVRRQVGLEEVRSGLKPIEKVSAVTELRDSGLRVGMVGDGINDAPALAAADVGIAMGVRGTAVAMETADVALMTDDLRRLPAVVALGRRALRVIRLNVAFAIAIKVLVLALAVAGHATLWMAVAADVGASLIVILHGLTLLRPRADHSQ